MVFPPAFPDSSSCWNTNHNQLQQIGSNTHITTAPSSAGPGDEGGNNNNQEGLMDTASTGGGGGDGGGGGGENSKPMSMSERARLARVPRPESGLNCPRCDSTNTKFCYFNNYSLTQPRHFCRTCRRYWTRGGALRNIPVSGRYRRHAKCSTKPKAASASSGAGARTSSATSTTPSTTTHTTPTSPALQYSMFGSSPAQGRFVDSFDPVSLGLSFPARLLFADGGAYAADGGVYHHHQGSANGMEQWPVAQMQSFPFLHAMDHQMAGPPAAAMPTTMAAMQGMFHLGLVSGGSINGEDDGGAHHHHHQGNGNGMEQWEAAQVQSFPFLHAMDHHMAGPPAAAMATTMVAMQGMFHLGVHSGGNGGGGYNFYSSMSNAAGN